MFTDDCTWWDGKSFLRERDEILRFLTQKWEKQEEYRVREELIAFTDNRVCFLKPVPELTTLRFH